MSNIISIDKGKILFGSVIDLYDKARPEYPERIYELLYKYIQKNSNIFEIGSGTGQVTKHLINKDHHIVSIEPNEKFADYLKQKFEDSLSIQINTFENVELENASFDFGFAATSLHWIKPEIALNKAFQLLRPNGWFAMWWSVYGDIENPDDFTQRTSYLFETMDKSPSYKESIKDKPDSLCVENRIADLQAAGFTNIYHETVKWNITMSAKETVDLFSTFSSILCLPENKRRNFLSEIDYIIDTEFDGYVHRNFMTPIYFAQKL